MARIVVVGGGFAGYSALKTFREKRLTDSHEIVLIDPSPRFVYLPSLPYLLSGKKSIDDISEPFSTIARRLGFNYVRGAVYRVVTADKKVHLEDGSTIAYDYLLITAGARPEFYNIPGADKTYAAWRLGHYIKLAEALREANSAAVIGGGLTGVEVAGELAEKLGPGNITIIEKMERLVPFLNNRRASEKARLFLEEKGLNVVTGKGVTMVEGGKKVVLEGGERLEADLVVWTVGIRAVRIEFDKEPERAGRGWLKVDGQMRVIGLRDVYAAGDITAYKYNNGFSSKMAEEAILQGRVAALNIASKILGKGGGTEHKPIFTTERPKTLFSLGFNRGLLVWNRIVHFGRFPYTAKMTIEHIVMSDVKGRPLGSLLARLEVATIKLLNRVLG